MKTSTTPALLVFFIAFCLQSLQSVQTMEAPNTIRTPSAIKIIQLQSPLSTAITADDRLSAQSVAIQAQIFIPGDAPTDLGVGAFIKDDSGQWFQLAHRQQLTPGHHHLHFPLEDIYHWNSEPGLQQWNNYQKNLGHSYGIYFWSESSNRADIQILNLRTTGSDTTKRTHTSDLKMFQLQGTQFENYNAQTKRIEIATGMRWSLHVNPWPMPANPYASNQFQLDLYVTDPNGKEFIIPAFYKQEMQLIDGGDHERARANGIASYSVRFRPMQAGSYTARLEATWHPNQGNGKDPVKKIVALPPIVVHGKDYDPYVRVDAKDHRFFSQGAHTIAGSNKTFHWPSGLNIQCISDKRARQRVKTQKTPMRGFQSYKAYIDRLARAGGNSAEVWMSSWNFALEWNSAWPGHHGIGKYNESNAERLDQLLDYAWERDVRIILVINNHGQASDKYDPEWKQSPYNKINGGYLDKPNEIFTNADIHPHQEQLRRYIVARYADHPAVMCWKLWTEMNLTRASKPELKKWHAQAFDAWHQLDQYYRHPCTSHWCGDYTNPDPKLVQLTQMDFIAIDAYHKRNLLAELLHNSTLNKRRGLSQFKKPIIVTEFGGNWNACPIPQLIAEQRSAAWAALVSGHAAAPHLWWFEWVDQHDHWQSYRAIQNFLKGEDMRDANGGSVQVPIRTQDKNNASAQLWSYAWQHQGHYTGYIIDREWGTHGKKSPLHQNFSVYADNLAAGAYSLEWWDANLGNIIASQDISHAGGKIDILVPNFRRHLAYKLRRIKITEEE